MRQAAWLKVGLAFAAFGQFSFDAAMAADADSQLPVIVNEDFERGAGRWQTTDPDPADSVWEVVEAATEQGQTGNHAFRVKGISKYEPPFRSPHSIAWLKDAKLGDFEITARVQNTNPSGGDHRDLCIFWGRQSPSEFYYVHLGAKADPHACQIFIVNNDKRTMITRDQAKGTPWTDGWHKIKVTRDASDGTMKVYFDDMSKPQMTAKDTTFGAGEIGIGTFDDSGNFDDIVVRGEQVAR
ncbi:MAG: hypothetical protein AB7G28_17295 [Pirellulales bacterium]